MVREVIASSGFAAIVMFPQIFEEFLVVDNDNFCSPMYRFNLEDSNTHVTDRAEGMSVSEIDRQSSK